MINYCFIKLLRLTQKQNTVCTACKDCEKIRKKYFCVSRLQHVLWISHLITNDVRNKYYTYPLPKMFDDENLRTDFIKTLS